MSKDKRITDFITYVEEAISKATDERLQAKLALQNEKKRNQHLLKKLNRLSDKQGEELSKSDRYLIDKIERLESELKDAYKLIAAYQNHPVDKSKVVPRE